MCGIIGGIGRDSSQAIAGSLDNLKRRGPDHQAVVKLENGLTMGATRLAMTDPHPRSNQPMIDGSTGNVLVFNGEIYNYKFLRKRLSNLGTKFETESDTEVLLKCLSIYGIDIVPDLEGMFSFCFYDKKRNRLILARDYLGKKPLYYFLESRILFFASQVDLIKKYIKNTELNLDSIETYLKLGYLVDPETMYKNIVSVIPGEIICIDLNNLVISSKNEFIPNSIRITNNSSIPKVIADSLNDRVAGHNNFALSLSGGIDSSILALECSRLCLDVETYSMSWVNSDKDRYQYDSQAAKEIARVLNLKHKIIEMPRPGALDSILDLYVRAMGEPNSNPTGLSMMILYSEIAKDGHRLVLTGDGADEVFGGYRRYSLTNASRLSPKIKFTRSILTKDIGSKILRGIFLSTANSSTDNFWLYWHMIASTEKIKALLPNLSTSPERIYGGELENIYSKSNRNASSLMFKDLRTWLPMESNRKLDRISMWNSIEARSPFQSENVIGVGYQVMRDYNFLRSKRQIMSEAYPKLKSLPVVTSKYGFVSPLGHWLRNNPSLIRHSIESISQYLPFNKQQLFRLGSAAHDGSFLDFKLLWSVVVLNRWFEINK